MGNCAKWENQTLAGTLGKPVDNPCGKPQTSPDVSPPHAPPFQENLSLLGELVDALNDAVTLGNARLDALEAFIDQFISIIDAPLSPQDAIERIRQLRADIS